MTQQEAVQAARELPHDELPIRLETDRGVIEFWRDEQNRLCWTRLPDFSTKYQTF